MNPQNPRTTVIEFFYPGGFAEDYEFTARALGIRHYGVWKDEVFTAPDTPQVVYPEGFQGNEIPLSELVVGSNPRAKLTDDGVLQVEKRLRSWSFRGYSSNGLNERRSRISLSDRTRSRFNLLSRSSPST